MPTFDIIKKSNPEKTFRVASVIGKFDLESENVVEHFIGEISIPEKWSVGLIVGGSGTGKTTIAKQLFGDNYVKGFNYGNNTIIDDMPENRSIDEITKTFNSVGFNSPPSWLKKYEVLSNGEKMRVDLAMAILSDSDFFVFDEFTSVVDRQVAKVGSYAMQKAIRKTEKRFIAVTCHHDVEDWLLPDWVFNTDTMTFHNNEGQKKNRPSLRFRIFETKERDKFWKVFSRYHYLTHSIHKGCRIFVLVINEEVCGFCAVLQMAGKKNMKQGHRLVLKPDYQGLGLSKPFLENVGDILLKTKDRFVFTTSNPAMIKYLKYDKNWKCKTYGRQGIQKNFKHMNKTSSRNRITTTWEYSPI